MCVKTGNPKKRLYCIRIYARQKRPRMWRSIALAITLCTQNPECDPGPHAPHEHSHGEQQTQRWKCSGTILIRRSRSKVVSLLGSMHSSTYFLLGLTTMLKAHRCPLDPTSPINTTARTCRVLDSSSSNYSAVQSVDWGYSLLLQGSWTRSKNYVIHIYIYSTPYV
jgi:hypothetical protein